MSKQTKQQKNVLAAIGAAVNNIFTHREILYPFAIIAFIQLLVLEILYFSPRFPLNIFFEPLVSRLWSAEFMHYPANLLLLPKTFQSTQIPIYVIFNSFFIGVAIAIIVAINNDQKVKMGPIYRDTMKSYIHLFAATLITFLVIIGIFKIYSMAFDRALLIRSTTGLFFFLKVFIIKGAPYFQFLISVFVTAMFAYVIPVIVIDRRKIFSALAENFKILFRSFFFTIFVVLLPALLYIFVLIIRINVAGHLPSPDWQVLIIVINILVLIFIDAVTYTALSTHYLLTKENA